MQNRRWSIARLSRQVILSGILISCLLGSESQAQQSAAEIAEKNPGGYVELLKWKVLEELKKNPNKKDFSCIQKYSIFTESVKNQKTRELARIFLDDVRKNYSSDWQHRYPVELSVRWQEIKGNPVAKKDFAEILRMAGVKAPGGKEGLKSLLQVRRGISIVGPIQYLDPVDTVIAKLEGSRYKLRSPLLGSKNRIESAGFPLDSFHYYSLDLDSKRGKPNRLIIVTDSLDRVMAVQELTESPIGRGGGSRHRSVFNFVQMRRKGTPSYSIRYEGKGGNTITMRTVLYSGSGDEKEIVTLYMPASFASLCLFCCLNESNPGFADISENKAPVVSVPRGDYSDDNQKASLDINQVEIGQFKNGSLAFSNRSYKFIDIPNDVPFSRYTVIPGGGSDTIRGKVTRSGWVYVAVSDEVQKPEVDRMVGNGWVKTKYEFAYAAQRKTRMFVFKKQFQIGDFEIDRIHWSGPVILIPTATQLNLKGQVWTWGSNREKTITFLDSSQIRHVQQTWSYQVQDERTITYTTPTGYRGTIRFNDEMTSFAVQELSPDGVKSKLPTQTRVK